MAAMDAVDIVLWMCNLGIVIGIKVAASMALNAEASGLVVLCQCLVAFPVFSVMTVRATQETPFRPGEAKTLEEEFAVYGYPSWFFKTIRIVKSLCAVLLIVGLVWTPALVVGAAGIFVLMVGAVASHIKVCDPVQKSVPSFLLGSMCASMLWAYSKGCVGLTSGTSPLSQLATEAARWWLFSAFSLAFLAMVASMLGVKDTTFWLGNASVAAAVVAADMSGHKAEAAGLMVLLQCLIAFPVFSVMTVRATQETPFRPGNAKTLEEEFAVYGYPSWFFKTIRIVKSLCAVLLVVGIVCTPAMIVGALGIMVLMVGAVGSHIKVADPLQKSIPSFTLGCMSACVFVAYTHGCAEITEDGSQPPAIFATVNGRWAAFLSMVVVFSVLLFQMVTPQMVAPKHVSREALLPS